MIMMTVLMLMLMTTMKVMTSNENLVAAVDLEAIEGLEELHESFQPVRDYDNDDGMIGYYVGIKSKKVSGGTP